MVTFRCTQKLLKRWPDAVESAPLPPSTVLGDWFCTALNHRARRLILAVAERSLLPVVVPAKDFAGFPARLMEAVRLMLASLGVPAASRERELQAKHGRPVRYQVQLRDGSVVLIAVPLG